MDYKDKYDELLYKIANIRDSIPDNFWNSKFNSNIDVGPAVSCPICALIGVEDYINYLKNMIK